MTTEQKFTAAVNVIRNLPKNGSFQPSTDLQLKFYSYFKQATEGPNTKPKPSFWDIPGVTKWNAWKKLGQMGREEAMSAYIEELMSIVETMSYNANVEEFLGSLGSFYDSVPAEDVDLVFGSVIEKVKSRATSPLTSRDSSPGRLTSASENETKDQIKAHSEPNGIANGNVHTYNKPAALPPKTHQPVSPYDSDDEDEFTDPMETTPQPVRKFVPRSHADNSSTSEVTKILQRTVAQLQKDVDNIRDKVQKLETSSNVQKKSHFFLNLTPSQTFFILAWPFVAHYIISFLKTKKSQ